MNTTFCTSNPCTLFIIKGPSYYSLKVTSDVYFLSNNFYRKMLRTSNSHLISCSRMTTLLIGKSYSISTLLSYGFMRTHLLRVPMRHKTLPYKHSDIYYEWLLSRPMSSRIDFTNYPIILQKVLPELSMLRQICDATSVFYKTIIDYRLSISVFYKFSTFWKVCCKHLN